MGDVTRPDAEPATIVRSDAAPTRARRRVVTLIALAILTTVVLTTLRPDLVTWAMRMAFVRDATVRALDPPPALGAPVNLLVVGSDERPSDGELDGSFGDLTGARADAILVVRVAQDGIHIISVPRDLRVESAGGQAVALATLLDRGGRGALVDAVSREIAAPIHHYLEIDFAGVAGFVDSVGGIPFYGEHEIRDERSGLALPAGSQILEGATALAFLRARSLQEFVDGRWRTTISDDLARIQRHRDILGAMIDEGLGSASRKRSWFKLFLSHASTDATFTPWTGYWLARRVDGIEPDDVDWFVLPVQSRAPAAELLSPFLPEHVGGRLWLETRSAEAEALLATVFGGE